MIILLTTSDGSIQSLKIWYIYIRGWESVFKSFTQIKNRRFWRRLFFWFTYM